MCNKKCLRIGKFSATVKPVDAEQTKLNFMGNYMNHMEPTGREERAEMKTQMRDEEIERRSEAHSARIYAALEAIDKDAAPALSDAIFDYCDKWAEADLKKDEASHDD